MSEHLHIEHQAAAWLARKDGDGWSAAEQGQLDQWLGMATAHRVAYLRLAAAWSSADRLAQGAPVEAPAATPRRALPRWSDWRIAAAILVTIGAAAGILAVPRSPAEERFETRLGDQQSHALKDGSRLTLNTATLVRARVSPSERTVWLEQGEAYFEIAHDAAHPFVVMSGANRITVLGTKFTVRREAGGTRVVVVDGRVQVDNAGQASVILARHQKVLASAGQMLKSEESDARIAQALSWREGKLVFDQVTLDYAAGEFNRYNRKKLVMADPQVAKLQIGGRFDVGNVEGFAKLLERGFGLEVRDSADTITIASRRTR